MTELQLYQYITDNNIEWHQQDNDGTPDILIFPYISQLQEFCDLIKGFSNDDEGIVVRLKAGYSYVAIWMNDICEYYDINPNNVFKPAKP